MLDIQNCVQNCIKNAKTTKFLLQSVLYISKRRTCKVLSLYHFWFKFYDKFCSPYPLASTFYAYLITKIGNRNHNVYHNLSLAKDHGKSYIKVRPPLILHLLRDCLLNLSVVRRMPDMTLKTNQGSGTVIPLCITGRREKICSKSVVVVKRFRLIRAMAFSLQPVM